MGWGLVDEINAMVEENVLLDQGLQQRPSLTCISRTGTDICVHLLLLHHLLLKFIGGFLECPGRALSSILFTRQRSNRGAIHSEAVAY